MKPIFVIAIAAFALSALPVEAATSTKQPEIDQALSALPSPLRAKATVITYDAKGDPMNLRWGENDIYCVANQATPPAFRVACFPRVLKPQEDMEAKERAEGKSAMAIRADVDAAIASSKLPTPFTGATIYVRSGKNQADVHEMWVVTMHGVDATRTGLPTEKGNGTPWMMRSGTPEAHLMVPVKGSMETGS